MTVLHTGKLESHLRARRDAGRKLLVPYITGGYLGWTDAVRAAAANGADAIEIGIPFSDPVMDGPMIQLASEQALERGATPLSILHRESHPVFKRNLGANVLRQSLCFGAEYQIATGPEGRVIGAALSFGC